MPFVRGHQRKNGTYVRRHFRYEPIDLRLLDMKSNEARKAERRHVDLGETVAFTTPDADAIYLVDATRFHTRPKTVAALSHETLHVALDRAGEPKASLYLDNLGHRERLMSYSGLPTHRAKPPLNVPRAWKSA